MGGATAEHANPLYAAINLLALDKITQHFWSGNPYFPKPFNLFHEAQGTEQMFRTAPFTDRFHFFQQVQGQADQRTAKTGRRPGEQGIVPIICTHGFPFHYLIGRQILHSEQSTIPLHVPGNCTGNITMVKTLPVIIN